MSEFNPFALTGKTVLVTGASSGIGRATALACARLGAKLVVTGRDAARLRATFARLAGEGHRQVSADLTSDGDLANLVEACPPLDGVALCAGQGAIVPIAYCTKERFDRVLDVNFAAPVELLRMLLKGRKIVDAASVVFVSSVAGRPGGVAAGNAAYGASKAALDAAVGYFVREFSPRRIRFNSVCPGLVNTPLNDGCLSAEQKAADLARYPLGRHGEPDDVAHGIVYLLSGAASWVTGQRLVIDGGLTV